MPEFDAGKVHFEEHLSPGGQVASALVAWSAAATPNLSFLAD
jgi:hypothetical protein